MPRAVQRLLLCGSNPSSVTLLGACFLMCLAPGVDSTVHAFLGPLSVSLAVWPKVATEATPDAALPVSYQSPTFSALFFSSLEPKV